MTREELKKLQKRVFDGAKAIREYDEKGLHRGFDWRDKDNVEAWNIHKQVSTPQKPCQPNCCGLTKIERWIMLYQDLFDELTREGTKYLAEHPLPSMKHSKGWLMMKRNEAIEKWKKTRVALRGTDPRTQPLEDFAS